MYQLSITIIIIFTISLLFIVYVNKSWEYCILKGFWKGGSDFCNESELDLFLLYIGEGVNNIPGYILAKNNEGIIINNQVNFILRENFSINTITRSFIEYDIIIDWIDNDGYDFFPSKQKMYYYPCNGKIVLISDNETKAVLYKDNDTTDLSNKLTENTNTNTNSHNDIGEAI